MVGCSSCLPVRCSWSGRRSERNRERERERGSDVLVITPNYLWLICGLFAGEAGHSFTRLTASLAVRGLVKYHTRTYFSNLRWRARDVTVGGGAGGVRDGAVIQQWRCPAART